jgi:hypothetical protein
MLLAIACVTTCGSQEHAKSLSSAIPQLERSSDIAGPDANQNGVRDDIEAWINVQPLNEGQRKALIQMARWLQVTLHPE